MFNLLYLLFEELRILCIEFLHTVDAYLVERLKDIECSKEESPRTTGRVEYCDMLQCMVEMLYKQMVLCVCKIISYKLAYVEVVSDEIIDVGDFSLYNFLFNVVVTL